MKTVSLELSRKLKEAGYPQDAGFWYRIDKENPNSKDALLLNDPFESNRFDFIASPTADEILDQLPVQISTKGNFYSLKVIIVNNDLWGIRYSAEMSSYEGAKQLVMQTRNTIADAAAKMWLYLKKEKLI